MGTDQIELVNQSYQRAFLLAFAHVLTLKFIIVYGQFIAQFDCAERDIFCLTEEEILDKTRSIYVSPYYMKSLKVCDLANFLVLKNLF